MAESHSIAIEGSNATFGCAADDTVLSAALRAGLGFPHECNSGSCGTCKFEAVQGAFVSDWPEAPGLSPRDLAKGNRHLACRVRPLEAGRIKVRLDPLYVPAIRPDRRTVRFLGSRPLARDLAEFTFQDTGAATFHPGQYVLLRLPGVARDRAYSMSNLPNRGGRWELIVKRVAGGVASAALFERARPGTAFAIDGPYGRAYLQLPATRPIVCVAGGSGLGPMIAILRGALAAAAGRPDPIRLYYGGRDPASIAPLHAFTDIADAGDRIRFRAAISDAPDTSAWDGARGFIHEVVEREAGPVLAGADIYVAGPPPMVRATVEMARRQGADPSRIRYDNFY